MVLFDFGENVKFGNYRGRETCRRWHPRIERCRYDTRQTKPAVPHRDCKLVLDEPFDGVDDHFIV